jgi:HSP20 family protein
LFRNEIQFRYSINREFEFQKPSTKQINTRMKSSSILTILILVLIIIMSSALETTKQTNIEIQPNNKPVKTVENQILKTTQPEEKILVKTKEIPKPKETQNPVNVPKKQIKRRPDPIQSIFDNFWNDRHWNIHSWFNDEQETWRPHSNIYESEDHFTLLMELPGFERKDVNIKYERGDQDFLIISGEKKKQDLGKLVQENIPFGKFEQKFQLKRIVDIKANLENGLLKIILQRKPKENPKVIDVKIE